MPALAYRRNQHIFDQPVDLPTPTPPAFLNYFDTIPKTSSTPSPSEISDKLRKGYFRTPSQLSFSNLNNHNAILQSSNIGTNQLMNNFNFPNPSSRVHEQNTAIHSGSPTSMMAAVDYEHSPQQWNMYNSHAQTGQQAIHSINRRKTQHNRASSTSSQGSTQSARQYQQRRGNANATQYAYGGNPDVSPTSQHIKLSGDESSRTFSNHLPTPSHTPTQDSFLTYNGFQPQNPGMESALGAHFAMKQVMLDQGSVGEEDVPNFSHSGRHSVSSYSQDSPATPHTGPSDDLDERYKQSNQTGEKLWNDEFVSMLADYLHDEYLEFSKQIIPKFDRTMTEIYADELFNPAALAVVPPTTSNPQQLQAPSKNNLLSPYRGQLGERLQQAAQARSASPSTSSVVSRGISPFRNSSPFGNVNGGFNSAQPQLQAFRSQLPVEEVQPTTISPKDAMLDYQATEVDSKMPLFSEDAVNQFPPQFPMASQNGGPVQYDHSAEQFGAIAGTGRLNSAAFNGAPGTIPQQSFSFAPPSIPGGFHSMSFPNQAYSSPGRSVSSNDAPTPDFPAHLTSMDSSASEKDLEGTDLSIPLQKPTSSLADSGTYTCTYHGCNQRFETPQKLQKHKREAHRQNVASNITPGVGSGMSPAQLLARNSQSGPHKCERINPTTGKPCNTIFSRPYDLTRHEDTIHNIRKTKVRCALCVEEKTFSRNDALTRHMRVVHPEVDFPGKHRRRGGHHD